jgi:hypothetical protein
MAARQTLRRLRRRRLSAIVPMILDRPMPDGDASRLTMPRNASAPTAPLEHLS